MKILEEIFIVTDIMFSHYWEIREFCVHFIYRTLYQ